MIRSLILIGAAPPKIDAPTTTSSAAAAAAATAAAAFVLKRWVVPEEWPLTPPLAPIPRSRS